MNNEVIETEVAPEQAVAVRHAQSGVATISDLEQSFALAVRQRELLSEYIKKQLVPGKHFYQRGDQKPSLSKEGAEIILLPHNLAPDYELVSGPEQPPDGDQPYQITVKCILRRKGDPGSFVGSGMGSAGSHKGYWKHERGKPDQWAYQARQTDKFLCHNATLKMAQKSAMISATINSTAASEFFTQDMDDPNAEPRQNGLGSAGNPGTSNAPTPVEKTPPAGSQGATVAVPVAKKELKHATAETRAWFIEQVKASQEQATQFLIDLTWLMPNQGLEDLPLRFVPNTKKKLVDFMANMLTWSVSGKITPPYEADWDAEGPQKPEPTKAQDQPWYRTIIPIPHKGQKKDEYLKHPDTIGGLYERRHDDEDARRRLWGLCKNGEESGWVPKAREHKGKIYQPSEGDIRFYAELKKFHEWFIQNHQDKL